MEYQPVIIIGAARSGTKLVRDLIAGHPLVEKIPFDINYIWRIGNESLTHDEILPDGITPKISAKIQKYFESSRHGKPFLVEKTVSNSLRVAAVNKVFPDAKFIHLYRDGWDVIESAYRQWMAPPDWRYIIAKTRRYPLFMAFGYASSYAAKILRQILGRNHASISPWGPCYRGIYDDLISKPVLEVCAIQWSKCVRSSVQDLCVIPHKQVYHLRYEDFIHDPQGKLIEIAEYLGCDPQPYLDFVTHSVSSVNIGKGLRTLSSEQRQLIDSYVLETGPLLESLHQKTASPGIE